MGTKKLVIIAVAVIVGVIAIFFVKPNPADTPLRVFTWSNYYPEEALQDFTKQTGIKVELSYVSSNEELFAKFKAGATGFDIIQPSDYMVRNMSRLAMLAPIDHRQLANLHYLDPYFQNLAYDPGLKYSVPFTWGTTGIAVNTDKVKIPADGVGWKLLYETADARHTSLLDDMREVFGGILYWKGLSINSSDVKVLEQARGTIGSLKSKILMFSSEPKPLLLRGELNIVQIFSTDGVAAQAENPSIKYFIPKEGATLWTDNFAIPSTSQRITDAHTFINFFLNPDNALKVSVQNHLATPNKATKAKLPASERDNPHQYPPKSMMDKLQMIEDLGDILPVINRMWTELKSS